MSHQKGKSWVPAEGPIENWEFGFGLSLPEAKLGVRIILAVASVLFFLLIVAYVVRMGVSDWKPLPEPSVLWFNTVFLVFSSAAFHWSKFSAKRKQIRNVRFGLQMAGALAFCFLIGQLYAWQELRAMGYLISNNPANSFFYLITAIHGLHILGGLVAWQKTTRKVKSWKLAPGEKSREAEGEKVRLNIELCATYWDFLLVVWLAVFGLMLST